MKKLITLLALTFPALALSQTATWQDSLKYSKPPPINIGMPAPSITIPQYFVNLTTGTGSICSQSDPCATLAAVNGKDGTTGGPFLINVQGTGACGNPTLYGGAGANKGVIRAINVTVCTGPTTFSNRLEHVIFDGGPKSQFTFKLNSAVPGDSALTLANTSTTMNYVEWKNVRFDVDNEGNWVTLSGRATNLTFTNTESSAVGASTNSHSMYFPLGSGSSSDITLRNCIIRDAAGYAVSVFASQTLTNFTVDGCVIHDVDTGILFRTNGGTLAGTWRASDNRIWDTTSSCIIPWSTPSGAYIFNNTCYNWGNGAGATNAIDAIAIPDASLAGTVLGDVRGNIFYATGNTAGGATKWPFAANTSNDSYNACISGANCGSSSQILDSSDFASLTENNANFLKLAGGSNLIDASSTLTAAGADALGFTRARGAAPDMGAIETGTGAIGTRPSTPSGGGGINAVLSDWSSPILEREGECLANSTKIDSYYRYKLVIKQPANGGTNPPIEDFADQYDQTNSCTYVPPPSPGGGGGLNAQNMPIIDNSTIPSAATGYSNSRIATTSYLPGMVGQGGEPGSFRTACGQSHFLRDDPLVYPNQPGVSHLHHFWGNTGLTANSTTNSVATTGNSTCSGGIENRSAYWVPAMVDIRNGEVQSAYNVVYYKKGYTSHPNTDLVALPQGLRVISGNAASNAGPVANDNHYFECVANNGSYSRARGQTIPVCVVGEELLAELTFPQCWDGVNLDSPDHRSHMTHNWTAQGRCPPSHPVLIPRLSYNIHYSIGSGDDLNYWRLSSDAYADDGRKGGYSMHGDYMLGWVSNTQQRWLQNCLRGTGGLWVGIKDCHADLLGDGFTLYLATPQ